MNVTELSVRRLPGQTDDGSIQGVVTIQTDGKRTYILLCRVASCGDTGPRAALIDEAMRLVSRMPEHRRMRQAG
jgi:hypothetical protein